MPENKTEILNTFEKPERESTRSNLLLNVTFILSPRRPLLSLLVRLKEPVNSRRYYWQISIGSR
jgi:hypothetical protein